MIYVINQKFRDITHALWLENGNKATKLSFNIIYGSISMQLGLVLNSAVIKVVENQLENIYK